MKLPTPVEHKYLIKNVVMFTVKSFLIYLIQKEMNKTKIKLRLA